MQVVERAVGRDTGRPDDGHAGPDLRLAGVPATALALTDARVRLTAWARTTGLQAEQVDCLVLAAYEAMANVVDHAYDDRGGIFDLHAGRHDSMVTVTISDYGRWKPAADGARTWRGRGLLIIERAAPEFELIQYDRGTTVCMSWPVRADAPAGERIAPDRAPDQPGV